MYQVVFVQLTPKCINELKRLSVAVAIHASLSTDELAKLKALLTAAIGFLNLVVIGYGFELLHQ